jgi:hypothetical protein
MKLTHRLRAVASLIERHDLPESDHISVNPYGATVFLRSRADLPRWEAVFGSARRVEHLKGVKPFVYYTVHAEGVEAALSDHAEARSILRQRARTADRRTVGAVA